MLKNKQPTKEVLIFNNLIKSILLIAFFIVINFIINDFSTFKNLYSKSFQNWEHTKDYVVIPSTYKMPVEEFFKSPKYYEDQKELYIYFNKKGAILAKFHEFMPMDRKFRLGETKYPYESDNVTVNPNYMKCNPIYDVDGNPVEVAETVKDTVLLVPEKYKNYENDIIELRKFWNKGSNSDFIANQKINIIWIKSGQQLFSYNLDVNPDNGNCVTDAFVKVTTECNGAGWDYNVVMAYKGNPLKIKIDPSLSIDDNVRPKLKELGYSQYVTNISKVNAMLAAESNTIKEKMYLYLGTAILIGISLILVLIQNVFNFFNQYKQYLAVRHLQGYGVFERYKEYFGLILSSWIIISIAIYTFGKIDLYLQIKLSLILMLFELLLSVIVLILRNKKNITSVIKGS